MNIGWVALAGVVIAAAGGLLPGTAQAAADEPLLVAAARDGNVAAVRDLLAAGADVGAASVDGATALHWAAHRDLPELVRLLIEAGADVSATNRYGVQPIALAATNGSAVVLETVARRRCGSQRVDAGRRDGADDRGAGRGRRTRCACCCAPVRIRTRETTWAARPP